MINSTCSKGLSKSSFDWFQTSKTRKVKIGVSSFKTDQETVQ